MAETVQIPVINLSSESAANDILDAASTFGFVYINNDRTVISPTDIQSMFDLVFSSYQV
jgi:hypothetical protein